MLMRWSESKVGRSENKAEQSRESQEVSGGRGRTLSGFRSVLRPPTQGRLASSPTLIPYPKLFMAERSVPPKRRGVRL